MDGNSITRDVLAQRIDHAVLRPEATSDDLRAGCEMCARCGVFSICVRPCDVAEARRWLAGSNVAVGTVVGFPHGIQTSVAKACEAARAIQDSADELDMVIHIGKLRDGALAFVRDDIAGVVATAEGRPVKVILECCYLDDAQKAAGCQAVVEAGAQFVKTSTGFGPGGATVEDVALLRRQVGPDFGVKAAGGIRTLADAKAMIAAGANRLGCSCTEALLAEIR